MNSKDQEYQRQLHLEFLRTLHEEKIKTQEARTAFISSKFVFITGLFGLGVLKYGTVDFHWLLYLVPLVAIGYDLYIRAEDFSIKKIGAFLRSKAETHTTKSEIAWEIFSAEHRDRLAGRATSLFTFIITIAAAVYILAQQNSEPAGYQDIVFWIGFCFWLAACSISNLMLWRDQIRQIAKLDKLRK